MALYTLIKLVADVAPKKYVDRHTLKLKRIATLDLSLEESVQVLGLSFAGGCGLFLLGNYGVEGDFYIDQEEWYFGAVIFVGIASLLVTAVWKMLIIRAEIKSDNKATSTGAEVGEKEETEEEDTTLTEISLVWVGLGILVTTMQSSIAMAQAYTLDKKYERVARLLLPIVVIFYVMSIFAQPRRRGRRMTMFLRCHFFSFAWISEISCIFYKREDGFAQILTHIGRVLLQTAIFHCGLRLRASIGRLPNADLSELLMETLFKGGFKALASVLFVMFRSLKCAIEDKLTSCEVNSMCASWISVYFIFIWTLKLVHGSIKQEWRKEISLSAEKIAKMQISWLRVADGTMLAGMVGCGAFLFTLMSSKELDMDLVNTVGLTGLVAGTACFVSEVYTVAKVQENRAMQSELTHPVPAPIQELVDCCSWWFVATSFLISLSYPILQIIYTFHRDLRIFSITVIITPLAAMSSISAFF